MKTSKALSVKVDSLADRDSVAAATLKSIAGEIDQANESMMVWMRQFDPGFEGTEEEVKQYLLDQKKGIEKVAKDMNATLEKGKQALAE